MSKKLVAVLVIFLVLLWYALRTAQIPPASIQASAEVFYINNETVTIVEKDGWGLFTLEVKPRVSGFTFEIEFPEGTEYLIKVNGKEYRGNTTFKTTIDKDSEIYINFRLPDEDTKKLYRGEGQYYLIIKASKLPIWHVEYKIKLIPRKEKD
ncbi:hypothetical protein A3L04_02470 [Thermococcus chitonophagus]|uniref:Uncharacterized protein n=1 Tax=Thermococcus chitonophagus TaxID=54262 RepID=A0A160VQW1_9EURY|nr:hypothetical protein [Thermococcus chitonophagus]ASJ16021.1 hypothetical protein A3L04_02470 [Thermococcus chitonophagus]CUX77267.1 hypothetical protein CHITON_0488 [Thermococcus chitonophagus]